MLYFSARLYYNNKAISIGGQRMKILKNIGVMALSIFVFLFGQLVQVLLMKVFSDYYLKLIIPCIARIIVTVLLAWIVSAKVLKITPEELGIKYKKFDFRLGVFSVALPLAILIFYAFVLPGKPYVAHEGMLGRAVVMAVFAEGISAGITEELVFRGMIFRYMKKTLGVKLAVIIPAILFAGLHITSMKTFDFTDLLLLILAGSSVAVMFTLMALESGSIYPGALAHTLWNTLIIGGLFVIGKIVNGSENDSYIIIPVESESKLLTGGNFGVEAAFPGIIGYILISILLFFMIRTKEKMLQDNPKA